MPSWLSLNDPITQLAVLGAGVLILLMLVSRLLTGLREAAYARTRRRDARARAAAAQEKLHEIGRLSGKIIATSSSATIAGFEIVQQIEAVFIEGAPSPAAAVEELKAAAAKQGANAVINLNAVRLASGKCVANGDAVIVRRTGGEPARPTPPSTPSD
jgi:uncharacterized protein YbjQ (UPF0145 family)